MNIRQTKKIALKLLLALVVLSATGCEPDFYLTESEVAALTYEMRDEQSANNLYSPLFNQRLDILFTNTNGVPNVQSTNLATLLRGTNLGLAEQATNQINLDRMSGELSKQLNVWLSERLRLFSGINNSEVYLERLDSVSLQLRSRPVFFYDAATQRVRFDVLCNGTVRATIRVQIAGGWLASIFAGISNGSYPVLVDLNDYRVQGDAQLLSAFSDTTHLKLRITPSFSSIAVRDAGSTVLAQQIKDGIRTVLTRELAQPLMDEHALKYNYFALRTLYLTQATGTTPANLKYTYQARPDNAQPVLHTVARASDGKLYHAQSLGSEWGEYRATPFPDLATRIENDPTLVATGTGQLELAAVTASSTLAYAHWRDNAWGLQTTLGTPSGVAPAGFQGRPAIVASAPGQVEIICIGRNGGLWHLRRNNGKWQAATQILVDSSIAVAPFRDVVATMSGNKMIITFADQQNHLIALAHDLERNLWGLPAVLPTQETIRYAPALAPGGDGYVEVVYAGSSGMLYHRELSVQANSFLTTTRRTGFTIASESAVGNSPAAGASPELNLTPFSGEADKTTR